MQYNWEEQNLGDEELAFWVALSRLQGVGPRTFFSLLEKFRDARGAWNAREDELWKSGAVGREKAAQIAEARRAGSPEKELAEVKALGFSVVTYGSSVYPPLLREIYDPPPLLYVSGELLECDKKAFTVVGSRRATSFGREMAERLGMDLARAGLTVVSGMARGIDTMAHVGALKWPAGRTVAVLGSGLNRIYPWENAKLAREIAERGAVVSEFPLHTRPLPGNFPRRNRILSGWTWGTVLVEAGEKSGALITADFALEQGREVFAVPGDVRYVQSAGTNRLIRDGAKLVRGAQDILQGSPHLFSGESSPSLHVDEAQRADEPDTAKVMSCLSVERKDMEEIISETRLPASRAGALLSVLELKGRIRRLPGNRFERSS